MTLSTFNDDLKNSDESIDIDAEKVLTGLSAVFDTNKDGMIDFSEFTNIMKSLTRVERQSKPEEEK